MLTIAEWEMARWEALDSEQRARYRDTAVYLVQQYHHEGESVSLTDVECALVVGA